MGNPARWSFHALRARPGLRAEPDPGVTSLEAGAEIDRRVKAYVHDHPETTYRGAMGFVLGADPELKATYEQAA